MPQFEFAACAESFNLAGETVRQVETPTPKRAEQTPDMFVSYFEATCVAALEDFIFETANTRKLVAGETIAVWKTSQTPIVVTGKWIGKGMFSPLCVRWIAGDGKGLFGKGLAGYIGQRLTMEQIGHLPTVK